MKLLYIFILLLFPGCHSLYAQAGNIPLPGRGLSEKMDSLSWYISSGLAVSSGEECHAPGHEEFHVPGINFYFSRGAVNARPGVKELYMQVYELNELATDRYIKKDYANSTRYWEQALELSLKKDLSYEELHKIRPALNNNFFLAGDYTKAMLISSDGLANSEKIKDTNRIVHFSNVIGYIHMKQKNFSQASQYFMIQLQLSRAQGDPLREAHALYNLADLAVAERQYDKAIDYLRQSAGVYRMAAPLKLFSAEERDSYISNKMSEAYKLKGDLSNALKFAMTATRMAENQAVLVNDYDEADYYINAGDIYNRLQKPDSAILILKEGMSVAQSIIHREYIRDASEQLAIAFAQKKMFDSAYRYQSLFASLNDSIDNESNEREILQREAGLKIRQQEELQQAALEKQKLWRNIIIGIALFSLITLGFLYNRYRLRQKNRYQQQLNRQQNELFNAIAVTQDQERKRIAEDIHDSLGSILSAAKLKLSALKDDEPGMSAEQLEKYRVAMQLLDEASAELRNISHNIMPATLSKLGLVAALRNLISNISSHAVIQVDFLAHDFTERLDEKTEMSIYRIVLELINNIVKHAKASKVTIQLIRYPDYINLSAEDNGEGFDYDNELQAKKGIGLGNILSRVDYMGGKINVDTAPGRGTTVIIDIPYGR